jgi:hypothetical protein
MVSTPKTIAPVRPNAGIQAAYRKRLDGLLREMQDSVTYWLRAAYRANPPELAQDASPAIELRNAVRRLARRWQRRWNAEANPLAEYFAQSVHNAGLRRRCARPA